MGFIENIMTWLTSGGWEAILTIVMLTASILSTIATKLVKGPKGPKIESVADGIKSAVRTIGGGKFKDEPGGWSVPFVAPDTKLRVVDGKVSSIAPGAK